MLGIISQPSSLLLSVCNDNITTLSSTTISSLGVVDYRFIADVYINGILELTLKTYPDPLYNFGVFNTRNIISPYVKYDFPQTVPTYLVSDCSNSSAKVYIQFGEEYTSGSTFIQNRNIVSGSTVVYINASLTQTQEIQLNLSNYILQDTNTSVSVLDVPQVSIYSGSTYDTYNAYTNQRKLLYVFNNLNLSSNANWLAHCYIYTYDINANQLGLYELNNGKINPVSAHTYVQCIDVGIPQIAAVPASGITILAGSTPIFTNNVASYIIQINGSYNGPPYPNNGAYRLQLFNVKYDCGRFASGSYTVFWMNEFGGFNSWLFNKKNITTQNKTQSTYKKALGQLQSNGSYNFNTYDTAQVPFYTTVQDTITMTTDFLADNDVLYLKSLFSSPVIYLVDQTGLSTSITIQDNAYIINKIVNGNKAYTLAMTVNQSVQNFRQQL